MTNEELTIWRAKVEKSRTLIARLEAGDELHREAAQRIRDLKHDLNEEIKEAQRGSRNAYQEGRWHERKEVEREQY